ncbi:MAG: ABC transporter substrate-binding protein [Campylobacterota bacterium]|nr:ABC transporter substrate-binding protein [Campylobacterota bacterium]
MVKKLLSFSVFIIILVSIYNLAGKSKDTELKKIAFITLSEVDYETFRGFKKGMETLGWVENKTVKYIIPDAAKTISNLDSIVAKALKEKPDLIFVSSTPATQAVKKAVGDSTIPVVFCPVNDPLSAGILKNTISPEALITGIRPPASDKKRFEWLMRISPNTKNILIPYTPKDDSSKASRADLLKASANHSVTLLEKPLNKEVKIDEYLSDIPNNIDAIFLPRDSNIEVKVEKFSKYAIEHKIPLCVPSYQQVQKGALFAYGFIHYELGYEASEYANKILKGVSPSDLPVKFGDSHLVLNKTTAQKIGIKFNSDSTSSAKVILEK